MKKVIFLPLVLLALIMVSPLRAQESPVEEKAVVKDKGRKMKSRNYKIQAGKRPVSPAYGVSIPASEGNYVNNRNYKQQTVKRGQKSKGTVEIELQEVKFNRNYKRQF